MRRILALAATALAVAAVTPLWVGRARATPPSGVTNPTWSPVVGRFDGIHTVAKTDVDPGAKKDFWKARIDVKGATDVHVLENIIAPDGTFGWHSHPGPSMVIVKSGTLSVYHAPDCMREDFGPGSPLGTTSSTAATTPTWFATTAPSPPRSRRLDRPGGLRPPDRRAEPEPSLLPQLTKSAAASNMRIAGRVTHPA